jgi:hypothetical protein
LASHNIVNLPAGNSSIARIHNLGHLWHTENGKVVAAANGDTRKNKSTSTYRNTIYQTNGTHHQRTTVMNLHPEICYVR